MVTEDGEDGMGVMPAVIMKNRLVLKGGGEGVCLV